MNSDLARLSEDQEMLLMRYLDGECGFWERRRAQKLLTQRTAQQFVEEFLEIGQKVALTEQNSPSVVLDDLWGKISNRIDQEKRAEVFLGPRRAVADEPGLVSGIAEWFSFASFGRNLTLAGGLVAACLGFVMVQHRTSSMPAQIATGSGAQPLSESALSQALGGRALQPVNMSLPEPIYDELPQETFAASAGNAPQALARRPVNEALEVDWMRSAGRVKLMRDPEQRSTIIWIRKRQPLPNGALSGSLPASRFGIPAAAARGQGRYSSDAYPMASR
ncbi:MAG: hypothetical protein K1X83_11180 [Oligoflexia bacterium]|nr:hypothetical protein [Oligoflexia bacterium]